MPPAKKKTKKRMTSYMLSESLYFSEIFLSALLFHFDGAVNTDTGLTAWDV